MTEQKHEPLTTEHVPWLVEQAVLSSLAAFATLLHEAVAEALPDDEEEPDADDADGATD